MAAGYPHGASASQFQDELASVVSVLASRLSEAQEDRVLLAWDLWESKLQETPPSASVMVEGLLDYLVVHRAPAKFSRKIGALAVSLGSDAEPPRAGEGKQWAPIRLTRVWARTYHLARNAPAAAARLYRLPMAVGKVPLGGVELRELAYSTKIPEVTHWADTLPLTVKDRLDRVWSLVRSK